MTQFAINTLLSALIIATVTEIGNRFPWIGAALVSLPLTSIVAFGFLYHKTGDATKVIAMSYSIFWLVIPSLIFFLILPVLIKYGLSFWLSLGLSILGLAVSYPLYWWFIKDFAARLK